MSHNFTLIYDFNTSANLQNPTYDLQFGILDLNDNNQYEHAFQQSYHFNNLIDAENQFKEMTNFDKIVELIEKHKNNSNA